MLRSKEIQSTLVTPLIRNENVALSSIKHLSCEPWVVFQNLSFARSARPAVRRYCHRHMVIVISTIQYNMYTPRITHAPVVILYFVLTCFSLPGL